MKKAVAQKMMGALTVDPRDIVTKELRAVIARAKVRGAESAVWGTLIGNQLDAGASPDDCAAYARDYSAPLTWGKGDELSVGGELWAVLRGALRERGNTPDEIAGFVRALAVTVLAIVKAAGEGSA